jgi:6-phosphogluconate dehydrogenase
MRIGMVGLGRMGANMTQRLLRGGHEIVAYDVSADAMSAAVAAGAEASSSLEDAVARLAAPRVVWVMLPAGEITEATLRALGALLERGDVIVDGGNANYRDTQRRARELGERGITLLDVGTSGGVWGRDEGYSLMIGGDADVVASLQPLFATLAPAPERGWARVGPSGAGHYVKMIHNGIEYGMMQAYAEGFALLERKRELKLDLAQIARVWQHGSVVRSWLLDLTLHALEEDASLERIAPWVEDSGEGRWAVAEAIELDVPAPVITLALLQRLRSRDTASYADRLLAAIRQQFGGHAVRSAADDDA